MTTDWDGVPQTSRTYYIILLYDDPPSRHTRVHAHTNTQPLPNPDGSQTKPAPRPLPLQRT